MMHELSLQEEEKLSEEITDVVSKLLSNKLSEEDILRIFKNRIHIMSNSVSTNQGSFSSKDNMSFSDVTNANPSGFSKTFKDVHPIKIFQPRANLPEYSPLTEDDEPKKVIVRSKSMPLKPIVLSSSKHYTTRTKISSTSPSVSPLTDEEDKEELPILKPPLKRTMSKNGMSNVVLPGIATLKSSPVVKRDSRSDTPTKKVNPSSKSPPPSTSKHAPYQNGGSHVSYPEPAMFMNSFTARLSKNTTYIPLDKNIESVTSREKKPIESLPNFDDIDLPVGLKNSNLVEEYAEKTYEYLNEQEQRFKVKDIMKNQVAINERMYEILINWLSEVNFKLKSVPEVLFMTVQLINRYLFFDRTIRRGRLQLLGITCYMIADKFESIYPANIRELARLTDGAYTTREMVKLELDIMNTLNFNIIMPNSHVFICRYLKAAHSDKKNAQVACYIIERVLQDSSLTNYLPSMIAASAIYISREKLGKPAWSDTLTYYTRYDVDEIQGCIDAIKTVLSKKDDSTSFIYRKYSGKQFGEVSRMFD